MGAFKQRPANLEQLWPALRNILVSAVAGVLAFVLGTIAWVSMNSDSQAGLHDFTLWPVLWLAVAVFVVTCAVLWGVFLLRKIKSEFA
jgi:hypothetical protein